MDVGGLVALIVPAAIAALGYVAKLAVQGWQAWVRERAARKARLLQLQALLRASRVAFVVQRQLAGRLAKELRHKYQVSVSEDMGLERLFTSLRDRFDDDDLELHMVIRGYTQHALLPINLALARWLDEDVELRTVTARGEGPEVQLAERLNSLDAHLRLWLAKYEVWIPGHPDHALVYLADEDKHGLGFPHGIEEALDEVLDQATRRFHKLDSHAVTSAK